jgi:hypothetical protein
MGTAVRPAKTSPGPWDAFADVNVFVGPPQVWGSGGNCLRMRGCIVGWVESLSVAATKRAIVDRAAAALLDHAARGRIKRARQKHELTEVDTPHRKGAFHSRGGAVRQRRFK